ncbi:MAG: hypothetical protein JST19_13720 [Bacteroidetes bacterium]|nr:hypothetical protein [Bacteroidota bacterium]
MKKFYSSADYKQWNARHAKQSLKKQLRFKKYLRNKNRHKNFLPEEERKSTINIHRDFGYVKIKVPNNFSFLENPVEVIRFITNLKNHFDTRRKVWIMMRNIQKIDYSAIVVLLSIMVRFKARKIDFNGDFPKNHIINKILIASGFFQTLYHVKISEADRYNIGSQNTIHTHAWKDVDSELGGTIMIDISNKILGRKAVYKGLQRSLVELMQNSYNHAEPTKEGEKHWWLSVNVSTKQKIAALSFIDYGVGIFESLNGKKPGSKWFNWKQILADLFNPATNADVLQLILNGELHKTVTGKNYRGKGLPGIKEAMDRNLISNLHIITNDVFADVCAKKYVILPNNFEGTFVYFEVNDQTVTAPWTEL